ncbi:MAG: ankyrin repeat domain-containing protein [Acidobacteria bacterium]|nr:ankyrin repeat domain-containing protein [Acidobacteriota bacterium]
MNLVLTVVIMSQSSEFFGAITKGDAGAVKAMLAADPSLVTSKNDKGLSPILIAQYYRKQEIVDLLLKTGVELDVFEASATGQTGRVRKLIERDPKLVNAFSIDGFFPLGLAVFFGHKETVELLLNAEADVHLVTRETMKITALHSAIAAGRLDLAEMLLIRGANPKAQGEGGFTPMEEAKARRREDLVKLLLRYGG